MKIGIMQPYLFPYLGYFQLINAVDKYVIYEDVNFISAGWINRNYILVNRQKHLFTISLDHASSFKRINEIVIKDDFVKFLRMIELAYKKAPFFRQTFALVEEICSFKEKNLALFVGNSIITISRALDMKTEFLISSSLEKNNALKGKEKVWQVCDIVGARSCINPCGGVELYDKAEFAARGIELKFLKSVPVPYKQFNQDFIPGLSLIDVLMFNPIEKIKEMLNSYEFI